MPIPELDPTQITLLMTGSLALTQIAKDLGVTGQVLKWVCVGCSVVLGAIMVFDPALWSAVVIPLIGAITTGGVSFAKEMASSGSRPSGD